MVCNEETNFRADGAGEGIGNDNVIPGGTDLVQVPSTTTTEVPLSLPRGDCSEKFPCNESNRQLEIGSLLMVGTRTVSPGNSGNQSD